MIGRRRQGGPPNPSKLAKREAKVVDTVRRSVRAARVREHPTGGGTLLTEPVLVFFREDQDLRVFDQAANQLGVARSFWDKEAKLAGYGIYGMGDEVPTVAINWRTPVSGHRDYTVLDSERVIAALSPQRIRFTSGLAIMAGRERIGYLSPWGSRWGHVNDDEGREVARIKDIGWARCDVADIEPSLAGPLRGVAVVASIIGAQDPVTQRIAQHSSFGGGQ
ncbi:MAG: hypothetical protein JO372_25040 [Solirubrobacterales bacterium]|nr:hypothetical protein [Solirubrobacterales bacterium]